MAHYTPNNPLEQLQLERIARCAAQLEHLRATHDALLSQACQRLATPGLPALTLLDPEAGPDVLDAALLQIQGRSVAPLFGLTNRTLDRLASEVRKAAHVVHTVADMQAVLPDTCSYLRAQAVDLARDDLGYQLWLIVGACRPPEIKPFKDIEFERMLARLEADELRKNLSAAGRRPEETPQDLSAGLRHDLSFFVDEQDRRLKVKQLVKMYVDGQPMRLQAVMPEPEVSDRLMRYQVSLDRQLSRCIGEFLQMRAMREWLANRQPPTANRQPPTANRSNFETNLAATLNSSTRPTPYQPDVHHTVLPKDSAGHTGTG